MREEQLVGSGTILCPTHDYNNGFATTLDTGRRENAFLGRMLDPIAPMTFAQFQELRSPSVKTSGGYSQFLSEFSNGLFALQTKLSGTAFEFFVIMTKSSRSV